MLNNIHVVVERAVEMDLTTRMVNAAVDHWPLVAAIAVASRYVFPWAVKSSLSNGGGDIIRRIVKEENAAQTKVHADELEARFRRHENDEDRRFGEIERAVFRSRRFGNGRSRG